MLNDILIRATGKLGEHLCKHRGRSFIDKIELMTDAFHRRLNNVNFDINKNGELRTLKLLSLIKPKCIFDVGANVGEWSLLALKLYPTSIIHAFEIVPSTYKEVYT